MTRDSLPVPRLQLVPLDLDEANALVERWHRHHDPVQGHKFSIGAFDLEQMFVCGAVIVGRPVNRVLDNGWRLEVTRCVTDGTPNACSLLYAAAWRAARAMGYCSLISYVGKDEPGTALKAAGWRELYKTKGGSWNTPARPRVDTAPTEQKRLWAVGEVHAPQTTVTLEEVGVVVPPEPESHEAIGSAAGRVVVRWPLSVPGGHP